MEDLYEEAIDGASDGASDRASDGASDDPDLPDKFDWSKPMLTTEEFVAYLVFATIVLHYCD